MEIFNKSETENEYLENEEEFERKLALLSEKAQNMKNEFDRMFDDLERKIKEINDKLDSMSNKTEQIKEPNKAYISGAQN